MFSRETRHYTIPLDQFTRLITPCLVSGRVICTAHFIRELMPVLSVFNACSWGINLFEKRSFDLNKVICCSLYPFVWNGLPVVIKAV